MERHGSSAAPSRQGSLASRADFARADSSADSLRQDSLRGDDLDQLLVRQDAATGPSPPRTRSLELHRGAIPSAQQVVPLSEPGGTPLPRAPVVAGRSTSPPAGVSHERQETVAQLLRQLSPKAQLTLPGRQHSLGSSQGASGGSIHRVSSLDGRDLTVEVIDRAPGLDSDATRQALRTVRSAQDMGRASLERARGGTDSSSLAAEPAKAIDERLDAAEVGGNAGKRSVDLARRLEGRSTFEGPARGMAAQQVRPVAVVTLS